MVAELTDGWPSVEIDQRPRRQRTLSARAILEHDPLRGEQVADAVGLLEIPRIARGRALIDERVDIGVGDCTAHGEPGILPREVALPALDGQPVLRRLAEERRGCKRKHSQPSAERDELARSRGRALAVARTP